MNKHEKEILKQKASCENKEILLNCWSQGFTKTEELIKAYGEIMLHNILIELKGGKLR